MPYTKVITSVHMYNKGYIIGACMPCAGNDIQTYRSHLIELERLVTEAKSAGLVSVVGDFNANIGLSNDKMNPEGVLIEQ